MPDTLELTCDLMSRPSVSPADGGCQALMGERLHSLGFKVENLRFGEVDNLWARRGESGRATSGRTRATLIGETPTVAAMSAGSRPLG